MNSTPSSTAITSSSSSAGIQRFVLLYTRYTCSTPVVRFAALAVSIAVLPPPITTTFLPISSFPSFALKSARNSSAFLASPCSSLNTPGSEAPTARITVVNPSAFSAAVSFTSVFRRTSTPIFSRSAASLSIDVPGILNSGITWRTTPPRASFFSNTVTAIPALRRK